MHIKLFQRIVKILILMYFNYLPCTCKTPIQDDFVHDIFSEPISNFFGIFMTFGIQKMTTTRQALLVLLLHACTWHLTANNIIIVTRKQSESTSTGAVK